MATGKSGNLSKVFVWIILVLLIVGLAGFGATNFGGNIRSVGTVGDAEIPVNRFARSLDQEITALSNQVGRRLSYQEAQSLGLHRRVLAQLVDAAAVEHEAKRIGLSVGDAEIGRQLTQTPQFLGADGSFDQRTYEFVLEQSGTNPAEYEETVRTEMSVTLLQAAVTTGVAMPREYSDLVATYLGERRSFSWITLEPRDLAEPVTAGDDAALQAFYDEDPTQFMLPETRDITYAWLSPDDLIDTLEFNDEDVRDLYEERSDEYNQPERRLLERLVFADTSAAQTALDAITSGEMTFDTLVEERGLTLEDVDLGDVRIEQLGDAGQAVFAATQTGVVGPVDTDLGPALFRINAILAARSTPFEDVADSLRAEYAGDRARRVIADQITDFDDLLAGGATIEDLASETDMTLGQITLGPDSDAPIAAYQAFADAASIATTDDFPEIIELEDGGLVALRINAITPAQPEPFDSARDRVAEAWAQAETNRLLNALAEELATKVNDGARLSSLGYITDVETDVARLARVGGAPAGLVSAIFDLNEGDAVSLNEDGTVVVVQLNDITEVDTASSEIATLISGVNDAVNQSVAVDILEAYTRHIQGEAGIEINQAALDAVLNQIHSVQ